MAFAQPIALALFALFVPVILLYLLKQRRRRVTVSNLLFWERVLRDEHTITSFTRLRKILSLLLQLLIVSLLVLALSRPLFAANMLGARRIVLLIDNSASMTALEDGESRFDLAKRQAAGVIRGMGLGDTLMLVSVASRADIVMPFTNGRKDLLDALDQLPVSHGNTRFDQAFEMIGNLPPADIETHVYIVSDGAFDPVKLNVPEKTLFAYIPVGSAKNNVGIAAFQLRPLPASPRDFEIYFQAVNHTEQEQRVPFEVHAAGALVDAGEMHLPAGESAARTVRQFSTQGGEVELFLDFDDAYPLDNRAYGVLPDARTIPVTLVTDGNLFLESALRTDDEIDLTTMAPAAYSPPSGDQAATGVVIFDRWAPTTTPPGNCIFLSAWPSDLGINVLGELTDVIVTDWDDAHPINRHVVLTNVTIRKAQRINLPEGFIATISSFEDPLGMLRKNANGEALVLAFDESASDLPLRVAYPILVANSVRYMAGLGEDRAWQTPAIGDALTAKDIQSFVSKHTEHANESIARVLAPDEPPPVAQESAEPLTPFDATALVHIDRAGVYHALTVDRESRPLFAANINSRRESQIAPSPQLPVQSGTPLPMVDGGLRLGSEPWFVLAALAFGLLGAEWWFFHRRVVE